MATIGGHGSQIPGFLGDNRDGLYRSNVVRVNSTRDRSAAADGELTFEESGTLFLVPGGATGQLFQLPKISSKWLGVEYTFHVSTQSSSTVIKINCALDSSASIKMGFSSRISFHSQKHMHNSSTTETTPFKGGFVLPSPFGVPLRD